jgi:hypothetical protein
MMPPFCASRSRLALGERQVPAGRRSYAVRAQRQAPERASIEESYTAPSGPAGAGVRGEASGASRGAAPFLDTFTAGQFGGSRALGSALGGAATDALFAAANVFSHKKPADGWEEIR